MGNQVYGVCHLCGREMKLTYEHIPPKATGNSSKVRTYTAKQLIQRDALPWDTDGLKYKQAQQGSGQHSLCEECNNNTGSWYGDAFNKFYTTFEFYASKIEEIIPEENFKIILEKVQMLPIIKQILSMFCSINSTETIGEDLKKFVMDKESTEFDFSKYKLCMYLTTTKDKRYCIPWTFTASLTEGLVYFSELVFYPFGFILYFDPKQDMKFEGFDITSLTRCKYGEEYNVYFSLPVYERNTWGPLDFRTKEEVIECIQKSKERRNDISESD